MTEQGVLASVIILTKNGEQYLRSLMDALVTQELNGNYEIIVIDSGSKDGTLEIVSKYPEAQLHQIRPEEFGHGRTRNLGARLATGELLVYIPQDATPVDRGWLEKLLRPFADARVAGAYARQLPRQDANAMEKFFLGEAYSEKREIRSLSPGQDPTLTHCFFSTVSGAIRTSIWKDHPFREDIIMSEDQAWAVEVMLAGHMIAYTPEACVVHSHQYTIPGVLRRNFDAGYSVWQIYSGKTGIGLAELVMKLARETAFVMRDGTLSDWIKFIPYEIARYAGFMLGVHADSLPLSMRKKLTHLPYYWEPGSEVQK